VPILNHYTSNLCVDLGRRDYIEVHDLQRKLVTLRKLGRIGNVILFVEHFPVFTIGRKSDPDNYRDVRVIPTERGGDVTYHGPGQVVVYFIFDTRTDGKRDVGHLLSSIENATVSAIGSQGFHCYTGSEPGFWIAGKKIGSFGMALDDFVSYHGIAINHSDEVLHGFSRISACGLDPGVMGIVPLDVERFKIDLKENLSGPFGPFRDVSMDVLIHMTENHDSIPASQMRS